VLPTSLLALSLTFLLAGCAGVYQIPTGSPSQDLLGEFEPGRTTRAEVRARLGDPLYEAKFTVNPGHAEVYRTDDIYRDILWIGLPIPVGQRIDPAPLLAVYDPEGALLSIEYFGSQPSGARNDLEGHTMRGFNTVLGPREGTVRAAAWRPLRGKCLVVVAVEGKTSSAGLYLDARYLTTAAGPSYLRLEAEPGDHTLACREDRGSSNLQSFQRPGHPIPSDGGWMTNITAVDFECPADGTRYVRLAPGGGWHQHCAPALIVEPPVIENARELAIPTAIDLGE